MCNILENRSLKRKGMYTKVKIETVLHWFGVLCVVFGLIIGAIAYFSIDRKAYSKAKEDASYSWAGEEEKATYAAEKMLYDTI